MTHQEMWLRFSKKNALESEKYKAWAFGNVADKLAELTLKGIKTATSSAYILYEIEGDELPKIGEYNIILNSKNEAVCIIRLTNVSIIPFNEISEKEARAEGLESLNQWREAHKRFFTECLKVHNIEFKENIDVVFETFELVYKPNNG